MPRSNENIYQDFAGTTQKISVAAASAAVTNAFDADTRILRISTTTDCHLALAASPTATTNDMLLTAAEGVRDITIDGGGKLAAIRVTADGTLTVTELSK